MTDSIRPARAASEPTKRAQKASRPRVSLRSVVSGLGLLFPPRAECEAVQTTVRLEGTPEDVWQALLFYEEVPDRPPWCLRVFLPRPVRTAGDKRRVGAIVRCTYDGGYLLKRITALEPPRLLRFEVFDQQLGIEHCVAMSHGSYEIRARESGSQVALTTHYYARLRPRRLWRSIEARLAHRLHRHILEGMRNALPAPR